MGYYREGELIYAGRVGTGFTNDSLGELSTCLKKRTCDSAPFVNPPTGADARGVHWVRSDLVCEVEFTEWTDDGLMRHPSFKGLRADKPAKQVIREEPKMSAMKSGTNSAAKKGSGKSTKVATAVGNSTVAGVKISHPDRVIFADVSVTKLDLAHYYETVADWILPYVAGRPLTIVRCPAGLRGKCFFQKHWTDSLPDAVRSVEIKEKDRRANYVLVDDLTGLVSLVQMGVLEFHPWPAGADKLDRPDYLVFDLDPDKGVAWTAVVQGARDVRDRLDELGLKSFLRTSGGKGLHVLVPLTRRNSWDDVKTFAKSVADSLVREKPYQYIATMSKAKRKGKVFVDYLRNQRGATAIASFSSRARAGAPVATPIAWEELSARLKPNKYTVRNLPARLAKLNADPWQDFFKIRQSLTSQVFSDLDG